MSVPKYYWPFLWEFEGTEYEDDPSDRGGATKFGIDQRSHPDVDIRHLTDEKAKEIYEKDYWAKIKGDQLPERLAVVLMDIAVNNGRSRGIKWLQEVREVTIDGVIGPKTIAAAQDITDDDLRVILSRREAFYRSIAKGSQAKYLRGWLRRNNALRKLVKLDA